MRPNLKHNYFVKCKEPHLIGSTGFIQVRNNSNRYNSKYLYYFLTSQQRVDLYTSIANFSQTAFPSFNKDVLEDLHIPEISLSKQNHIVNTIGSVDDLIESNANFISKFQQYLSQIYKLYCLDINYEVELNSLIVRTGKTLKNKEWFGSNVLDLSTMPNNNIFINDFSCGENFTTNIKTLNNLDLVYGSIRPYFKKAGFACFDYT